MYDLAKDVVRQPFKGFLGSGGAADHVTNGGDNLLHTGLAVVSFQLWQLLKAQRHADFVASGCTDQTVDLVEIQRRQLIDDDAHRNVLALTRIDPCDETVQYQSIQRTDDAFHLRVIGDEQVTGMLGI